ncbi:hypothetical protein QOT17_019779 [Balamuthia mandrillaris]
MDALFNNRSRSADQATQPRQQKVPIGYPFGWLGDGNLWSQRRQAFGKRSLGVLSSSPAKVLRSVPCVNNQRQQTLFSLHLQRQFYVSTNIGQNDNGPKVEAKKPLEEWSAQEIQSWLQQEGLARFAPAFVQLNGKHVSQLTKDDLQKEFGNLQGGVLFNALQPLRFAAKGLYGGS